MTMRTRLRSGLLSRFFSLAAAGTALVVLAAALMVTTPMANADQNESANPTTATLQSRITAGALHTCALLDSGGVQCWGSNLHGELGDGTTNTATSPVSVSGITTAEAVSAGNTHTCALLHGGSVACWGNNGNGQLGNGSASGGLTPVLVPGIATATAVSSGGFHACALLADGTVQCWGSDGSGQLGDGGTGTSPVPVPVQGITPANRAVAITAGEFFTCALLVSGGVQCWGSDGFGQLGNGVTGTDSGTPVSVTAVPAPGHKVLAVSAGSGHACGVVDDGTVHCWGSDDFGQLGNGVSGTVSATPVTVTAVNALNPPRAITAGQFHTCALLADGTVKCWGNNGRSQLGDLSTTTRMTPVPVFGLGAVTAVTAGGFHTCALVGSTLECWGYDFYGQLGGYNPSSASPVQMTDLSNDLPTPAGNTTTTVVSVSAGTDFACALIPDGSPANRFPYCWGSNANGRLGNGSTGGQSSVPRAVAAIGPAAQLDAGNGQACALPVASATPQCWGFNQTGQVGNATTVDQPSPVQVSGLSTAAQVSAGGEFVPPSGPERGHSCALIAGGAVECWGRNADGQLGNNSTTDSSVPVNVAAITTATAVGAGGLDSCALMADGTVQCWGYNAFGQLGNKTVTETHVPVTVHTITGATAIATGADHNCALMGDGSVQCWGHNDHGQLGDGSNTNRTEPVVVHTINVALDPAIAIAAGDYHTCALLRDNTVICWGDGADGQLGNGGFADSNVPVGARAGVPQSVLNAIAPKQFVTSLTASRRNTCVAQVDYTVYCWGSNAHGQLGDGIGASSPLPRPVVDLGGTLTGNHLPNPVDHTVATTPGVSVTVNLLQGATDADGDAITLASVGSPAHGTVSVASPNATYTPNPGFCGNDTFTYTVTDGVAKVPATVTVTMNCPPTPQPDTVTTTENAAVSLTVLANDTDPDHDPLTVVANDNPAHGTVTLAADGTGTYTPNHDVCGTDSFGYTVSDGHGHTASTSVTVTVTCVNQPPVAGPDTASTPQGTPVTINVLANDTDPDAGAVLSISTVGTPQHGTASAGPGGITYTPAAGFCGADSFPYTVSDGSLTSSTTVSVSVTCTNQGPHASPDTAATLGDTPVSIPVLNNDTDATPGATLTVVAATAPLHGTTSVSGTQVVYSPTLYFCGTDTFSYQVSDGTLADSAGVTVTVACVNHPPQPVDDAVSTPEDTPASFDVLANDTDPDAGQTLSLVSVTQPSHGTAAVVSGKARYAPAANYCGPDAFTYTVSDGQGGTAHATVLVTVTCVDDPPVIAAVPNQSTPWGSTLMVPLSATDIDGPSLTFSLVSGPLGAAVSPAGTFSWLPDAADIGTHSVTVQVSDGTYTSQTSFPVTVGVRATKLVWTGPVFGEHGDPATLSSVLTDAQTGAGIPSEVVALTVGSSSVPGTTEGGGSAVGSVVLTSAGGAATATAVFAGDAAYSGSSVSQPFTVTRENVAVTFAGQYLTLISGSTAAVPLTATVTVEGDDVPLGDLGTASVTFAQLGGGVLCSATVSQTSAGQGVASCLTTPPLSPGTRVVVVSVTGPNYQGPVDLGVFTVAVSPSGMATGAGTVGSGATRSDFGFQAVPVKKGASGAAVQIFRTPLTATVVIAPSLASVSTSCSTTRPKVCSATVQATGATTQVVTLATGAVGPPTGSSAIRIDATDVAEPVGGSVPPDRYAVSIAGSTSFGVGTPTSQELITAGNIRIPG